MHPENRHRKRPGQPALWATTVEESQSLGWAGASSFGAPLVAALAPIGRAFLADRERWVLWMPVLFGIGIGIYFTLPQEPPIWIGPSGLGFLVLLVMAGRLAAPVVIPAGLMGLILAGFTAADLRTAYVAAPVLQKETRGIDVIGTVRDVEPRTRGVRLLVGALEIPDLPREGTPKHIRVTVSNGAPGIAVGDRVSAMAVLRPPPEPVAPGSFDFARYAFFQRIGAVGFVLGDVERLPAAPENNVITRFDETLASLRQGLIQRIGEVLKGESGAIATALMTGERGAVPEETMTALRDAGLAHLLAISGLHVGLVAGLIFVAMRAGFALIPPLALRWPTKKLAALAAILAAAAYLLLVGATVPTQRAFLMTAVVLLGVALDRTAVSMRLVAWAALAVLAIQPESLLSVSFQMSFAAVTALVAVYEALRERGVTRRSERGVFARTLLYFGGVALTSLVAATATAPFALFHFNRVALFGLAANMIAVPLMAFWVMPWALVAYSLIPFGAATWPLQVMGFGIDIMLDVAKTVAAWPGAAPVLATPPSAGLLCLVGGALWLSLWSRRWRLLGLLPMVVGLALTPLHQGPDVLVSRDAALMAVRGEGGRLWLSNDDEASFSADIWQRRAGQTEAKTFAQLTQTPNTPLRCDSLGCIYRRGQHVVALVQDGRALSLDCAQATLIIARVPVAREDCAAPLKVIDRFDIWRDGAHAIQLHGADWRVTAVRGVRGRRPWVRLREPDQ